MNNLLSSSLKISLFILSIFSLGNVYAEGAVPNYESLINYNSHDFDPTLKNKLPNKELTKNAIMQNPESVVCIRNDDKCESNANLPFGTPTHSQMVETATPCSEPLIRSVYWQDYFHQFESKAHFDNCAFTDGINYIAELTDAVDQHIKTSNKIDKDKVMFTLGQALHAIQDFYAHSNYVELMQKNHPNFRDVPILPIWLPEGRLKLDKLKEQGLISGQVWWSITGKSCIGNTPTHAELAKDLENEGHGKDATIWPNWSNFEAARRLAAEATEAFLQFEFNRLPKLQQECGDKLIYIISQDKRSHPPISE